MTNDDFFADTYIVHRFAIGTVILPVNGDGNIHFDVFYQHPLPVQAYLRRQIRCRVEIGRKDAVLFDLCRLCILTLKENSTKLPQLGDDQL